jgi:hypothetical protein
MATNVATPTQSYSRQFERWRMLEDLADTKSMIAAGPRWLPQEEKELPPDYTRRLNRSILYPAFADTIETGVARMFSKPVTLQEADTLSDRLKQIEDDADLSGTSLTQFGRQLAHDGQKYGRFHFLVDFPATDATANLRDEQESGVRPYFAAVSPTDLIGWKFRRGAGGKQILAQIRVQETQTEADGEFGEKEVKTIRVLTDDGQSPAHWDVYTANDKGEYTLTSGGPISLGYIPLVTAYYDYVAPFESNPPYEGLAWQNIKHWRSSSEQDNLLRVARVPILTVVGIKSDEIAQGLTIGASKILGFSSPEAKVSFTEHSGAAIGAGADDLKATELRMETLGMAPMVSRSGSITATATAIDESKSSSDLEAWARVTESALKQGYEIAAEWDGSELHKDFGVEIATASDMLLVKDSDLQTLDAARTRGDITRPTYLTVLKARRILPKDLDVQAEADAAANEAPLGMVTGAGDPFEPEPDEDDEADPADADASGTGKGEAA